MKRKSIAATELGLLRKLVSERYRRDGGTELEWKSYLPRYEDLNARIQSQIHGQRDAAISPNILRRLFWETLGKEQATFNIVYLNALAQYISEGACDYREWSAKAMNGNGHTHPMPPEYGAGDVHMPEEAIAPTPAEEGPPALEHAFPVDATTGLEAVALASGAPHADPQEQHAIARTGHLLSHAGRLPWRAFMRPFMIAGLYSGLLSFMFVLTFNELSGYDWPGREGLGKIMTSYFGSMVFGHIGIGIALAFFARRLIRSNDPRRFFRSFLVSLPFLFLLTFYIRQLFVNNGWLVKGRDAFAFFGRPDLETVAIALAFCLCITLFLVALHRGYTTQRQGRLLQATLISLCCGTVFFAISTGYNILVTEGLVDPHGHFISPTILAFRFPHPERLPLICFMVFVQMYFTLTFVSSRSKSQELTTSEQ